MASVVSVCTVPDLRRLSHFIAVVDASGLLTPEQRQHTDVLNGIAALGGGEYLLTGKLWPAMFRVRLPD